MGEGTTVTRLVEMCTRMVRVDESVSERAFHSHTCGRSALVVTSLCPYSLQLEIGERQRKCLDRSYVLSSLRNGHNYHLQLPDDSTTTSRKFASVTSTAAMRRHSCGPRNRILELGSASNFNIIGPQSSPKSNRARLTACAETKSDTNKHARCRCMASLTFPRMQSHKNFAPKANRTRRQHAMADSSRPAGRRIARRVPSCDGWRWRKACAGVGRAHGDQRRDHQRRDHRGSCSRHHFSFFLSRTFFTRVRGSHEKRNSPSTNRTRGTPNRRHGSE